MESIREYVNQSNDYRDYEEVLKDFSNEDKGKCQELIIKAFFESHAKLYDVRNYYARVCDALPDDLIPFINKRDRGVDGYIRHLDGKISLVQVKYRSNIDDSMYLEFISNMAFEAGPLKDAELLKNIYLVTNTLSEVHDITPKQIESYGIKYLNATTLYDMDWEMIKGYVNHEKIIIPYLPPLWPWQEEFLGYVIGKGLDFGRKTIIVPCGAGKTRFCLEMIKKYDICLVCVPTLHLLSQTFEFLAKHEPNRSYILVGTNINKDSYEAMNVPYNISTDPEKIGEAIENGDRPVVISTYDSLDRINTEWIGFELMICDEAHVCCTPGDNYLNIPLQNDFPASNRLFMTATPKIYHGDDEGKYVYSMDNKDTFGDQYVYSFRRAIEDNIISDYKIITGHACVVTDYFIDENDFNALFAVKALQEFGLNSILVFSNSHKDSLRTYEETKRILEEKGIEYEPILLRENSSAEDRFRVIQKVDRGEKVIIFNVRVFILGSDIPKLDAVMLCGNRNSKILTVQSVSRCLRKVEGKEKGYILIPCLIKGEEYEDDGNYQSLRRFLSSMGSIDEALAEEIMLKMGKENGESSTSRFLTLDLGKVSQELFKISLRDEDFKLKMFERVSSSRIGELGMENWRKILREVVAHYHKNGILPRINPINDCEEERMLGVWVATQRNSHKHHKGSMSNPSKRNEWENALEEFPFLRENMVEEEWFISFDETIKFTQERGDLPKYSSNDVEERKLAKWTTRQRYNYKNKTGPMKIESIIIAWEGASIKYPQLIDTYNGLWYFDLQKFLDFYEKFNRIPVHHKDGGDPTEQKIGRWTMHQKNCYKKNTGSMKTPEIKLKWEEIIEIHPELKEKDREGEWRLKLGKLLDFYKQENRWPEKESNDKEEANLGTWMCAQRSHYKHNKLIMIVETIRTEWEEAILLFPSLSGLDYRESWRDTLNDLIVFYEETGKLPTIHSNHALLSWLSTQRANYKYKKHIMKYEDIRTEWENVTLQFPAFASPEMRKLM